MNPKNFNQNELEELLNPPKSKAPLILGLVLAFLAILFMGATGFVIYKAVNSQELQNALQEGLQQESDSETSNPEDDNLITITKDQASEWVHLNQAPLQALIEKTKAHPKLEKVWLATAKDFENHNIYAWINDVPCTANPAAVNNSDENTLLLFTDVLSELNVPVTAFYDLNNEMQALNIVGFELDTLAESVNGVNLYHGKYDGAFYYSINPKQMEDYGEHLFDNWWYFP